MQNKEELLKQLLLEYMEQHKDNNDIQIGNFIIKHQDQPKQHTPNIQQFVQEEPISNQFVMDCFENLDDNCSLDNFIQAPNECKNLRGSEENLDTPIKWQNQLDKQMFPRVNTFLDNLQEKGLRNQLKNALYDDFENLMIPIRSASSNTHFSMDIHTKSEAFSTNDPLRAFLLSLFPASTQSSSSSLNFSPGLCQKQSIDFLFVYSQPLVSLQNQIKKSVPLLEIKKEMNAIMDVLNCDGAQLNFSSIPARVDLFGEALDLMPLALHYSGHGIHQDSASHLLFETRYGSTNLISPYTLQQMLQKLQRPILFVFVASCHSSLIGEVFQKADAAHVICVNTKEKIMDEVCRLFARAFYHALIRGQVTVCQAFQIARDQIKAEGRFPASEENKFVMLFQNPRRNIDNHVCQRWQLGPGQFRNLSKVPKYSETLPGHVHHFMGRQLLLQEIVEKVVQNKLVQLRGILGIGKSALLKELSIYVSERMVFNDGVIYMSIAQTDSLDGFATQLYQILSPSKGTLSNSEMKQLIMTQLVQSLKSLDILFVVDNCDQLLNSSDREAFQDFLEILLSNCTQLHICLSSRSEAFSFTTSGKTVFVESLTHEDSLLLLLAYVQREVVRAEMEELLGLAETLSDRMLLHKLTQHPLMGFLNGHPQAIMLSSGLFENNSLKNIYALLCQKSWAEIPSEESSSLKLSLDLSWNNLQERFEKAAQFFAMLGLLPGGATAEDLDLIWGTEWEKWRNQLVRCSMVTQQSIGGRAVLSLHSFMVHFAESKLEVKQINQYHSSIVQLYSKRIQHVYQTIGTQMGGSGAMIETFLQIEPNIKAVIMRELVMAGVIDVAKNFTMTERSAKKNFVDDEEEKDFDLPLTKDNLEIMQKRYEKTQKTKSIVSHFLTNSVHSTNTFKVFDQSSEDHNKQSQYRRKSLQTHLQTNLQTHITISEEIEQSEAVSSEDCVIEIPEYPPIKTSIIKNNVGQKNKYLQLNKPRKNVQSKQDLIRSSRAVVNNQEQKGRIQALIIYHCQVLLLVRRYNECLRIINLCTKNLVGDNDQLFLANLQKTKACVFFMQKEREKSKKNFQMAKEQYIKRGCMLGVGSCEAAIGYIFLQDREFQYAKVCFENSLFLYETLNHDFGRHFLNRWLSIVKNKISSLRNTRIKHIEQEKQLIEHLKQEYKRGIKIDNLIHKKHRGGNFILRWLGDTISIFMEPAFIEDSKPYIIINSLKSIQNTLQKKKDTIIVKYNNIVEHNNIVDTNVNDHKKQVVGKSLKKDENSSSSDQLVVKSKLRVLSSKITIMPCFKKSIPKVSKDN